MPNYELAKSYMIFPKSDPSKVYIGATTKQYLSRKLAGDVVNYNNFKNGKNKVSLPLFDFFDKYGYQNCKIVLIEYIKCNNKDELNSKVNDTISRYPNCVNYIASEVIKVVTEKLPKVEKINDDVHLECLCGGRYTIFNIKQHSKTKKHIQHLESLKEESLIVPVIETEIVKQMFYTEEEELRHIENCKYRDYDPDIRSWKN